MGQGRGWEMQMIEAVQMETVELMQGKGRGRRECRVTGWEEEKG